MVNFERPIELNVKITTETLQVIAVQIREENESAFNLLDLNERSRCLRDFITNQWISNLMRIFNIVSRKKSGVLAC